MTASTPTSFGLERAGASLGRVAAVAHTTYREAIRNRVLYVFVFFAIALMAFSVVLGQLSMHEETRVIKDLGLAGISLIGVAMALFLGVSLLSKELDRKTTYFVLPKPLHRAEFLVGKFTGMIATLAVLEALMVACLWGVLAGQGGHHGVAMLRAESLIFAELVLLSAVALLFSSFSSAYLSGLFSAALWIIGRNLAELRAFATGKLADTPAGHLLEFVARVVPDFHLFYVSGGSLDGAVATVHESFVPWAYVGAVASYGASYTIGCLAIAAYLFTRRDFT